MDSPIKHFPAHWRELSLEGKRTWLINDGQARDWSHASSLLGKHAAVCKARRKLQKEARRFDRKLAPSAVRERVLVPEATVKARCDLCAAVVYEHLRYSDGSRDKRVVAGHRHDKFTLLCGPCVEKPEGLALIERANLSGRSGS